MEEETDIQLKIDLRRTGRELQDVQDGVHLSSGGRDSSDTE